MSETESVDPVAVVADLIRQWGQKAVVLRARAARYPHEADSGSCIDQGERLNDCAVELDAVLPALRGLQQEIEGLQRALKTTDEGYRHVLITAEIRAEAAEDALRGLQQQHKGTRNETNACAVSLDAHSVANVPLYSASEVAETNQERIAAIVRRAVSGAWSESQITYELEGLLQAATAQLEAQIQTLTSQCDEAEYCFQRELERAEAAERATARLQQALDDMRGTPEARFVGLLALLEQRYPDPSPCAAESYELRFLRWLDGLVGATARLQAVLTKMADDRSECRCEHDDLNCCGRVGERCSRCSAYIALQGEAP